MNLFVEYCESKFYSQFDSDKLIDKINKNIDTSITEINHEFIYIFDKMLTVDPCSYWDKAVFSEVYRLLEDLYDKYSNTLEIDETVFEYFLMGYNSYAQISEIILDLRNFNISQEIKTRLYRLPTYTSIIESCLSNFLRVIAFLTGKAKNKDYSSQNTLGKLVNVINSNGYKEIAKKINVNLRNAINHGKVVIKSESIVDKLCFYYVEDHVQKSVELTTYEFDRIIDSTFDTASGVLLGLTLFMNKHLELLNINTSRGKYVEFSLLAMKLSIPGIYCRSINDIGNNEQINIEIEIQNIDEVYITEISILVAELVFNQYQEYKKYMISFNNPRMATGWIRYTNEELIGIYNKQKNLDSVIKSVMKRNDYIIFTPSTEDIDLNEAKYFCFPNYTTNNYKINNIKDASLPERKRLRAHLFIGEIESKQEIINIINDAIKWLKM